MNLLPRVSLLSAAVSAALCLSHPLHAQESTQPHVSEGDAVSVVGYRQQSQRAIDTKRDTPTIAEFITQDDSGQNPDYNIADAFRRAPGVFAVFDEDEGRYAAVRGLNPDYSLVTLNGLQLASSDQNSRRVLIEQVPASAVSRLDVIKALMPNLDGNAIGGLLNLRTRSAFDADGTYFTAQALGGWYDSRAVPGDDKLSYRGDATFSTRFGADDQFGIVLSGSYLERTRDQERLIANGYAYYDMAGNPVANPMAASGPLGRVVKDYRFSNYTLTSQRFGGSATLEYKPGNHMYASLYYSHYTQDDDETRYNFLLSPVGNPSFQSPDRGSVAGGNPTYQATRYVISKPIDTAQGRFAYNFENSRLDARVSWSRARWDETGPDVAFRAKDNSQLGYSFTTSGVPDFSFLNPGYMADPSNFTLKSISSSDFNVRETVKDSLVDYVHDVGESWSISTGGKLRNVERTVTRYQPSWTALESIDLDRFVLGDRNYVPPYSSIPVLLPDRAGLWDYMRRNPGQFSLNEPASSISAVASNYRFDEDVRAVYLAATRQAERYRLTFGARYEWTEVDVERAQRSGNTVVAVREQSEYGNFLPSAVLDFDITPDLKFRAGISRAIGRPNQSDLAGSESRSESANEVIVSRSNPDLKPRKSTNFDVALEYYFDGNDGLASAGFFVRDIDDEIFRGTRRYEEDGVTWQVTEPQNLESARLTGFEVNLVKNVFEFLPGWLQGLGASANFTWIDTDASIVMANGSLREVDMLTQQPSRLMNVSIFYRNGGFESRLSYARTGRNYQTLSTATPVEDILLKPFDQLDLQLRYRYNRHLQFVLEGRNLLNEDAENTFAWFGEEREINQHGRGFWAGVSYNF